MIVSVTFWGGAAQNQAKCLKAEILVRLKHKGSHVYPGQVI